MTTTVVPVQQEDDIDLLRYGRFLASYWRLLAAFAIIGGAAGLLLAMRARTVYQASATMTVVQPTSTNALALTPATSRALLANLTLVAETLKESGISDMTPQAFVDQALVIQPVPTTSLLRLVVSLPDPTKARVAADILARKAMALSKHLDEEGAVAARDALKTQTDEAARRFAEAQTRLSNFQAEAQLDMRDAEAKAFFQQRGKLMGSGIDLEAEKSRLATLERELAASEGRAAAAAPGTTVVVSGMNDNSSISLPVAAALRYQVAESRAKVAQLDRQRRESESGRRGPAVQQVNEMYRLRVEGERLEADYEATKRVYGELAAKYGEAVGRVAGTTPQLLLVDAPIQPDRPMPRLIARSAMLGVIVGLALGVVAALVINRRRTIGATS